MLQIITVKTGVGPKQRSEFELSAVLSIKDLDSDMKDTCAVILSTSHLDQDLLINLFIIKYNLYL